MGKGSDLWDDSALINAFDNAMTTYKAMHSKKRDGNSHEEEKWTGGSNAEGPVFTEKTNEYVALEKNGNNTEATSVDLPVHEDNLSADLHAPCIDGKADSYSDQQAVEYVELFRLYNELEEQRQKVAQQLQAIYWNYQAPAHSTTSQAHEASSLDASGHGLQPACSYAPSIPACASGGLASGGCCCCSAWTMCCSGSSTNISSSLPADAHGHQSPAESGNCSIATSCLVNPTGQCTPAGDDVFKLGMMAAEKAISCMKKEISAISTNSEEREEGKEKEEGSGVCGGKGSLSIRSESDLSAVLGAWYAAGFHTGRYLMEQSKRNTTQ